MSANIDVLKLRRPKVEYIAPAICEAFFSGTGSPVIVLDPFGRLLSPSGFVLGGEGGFTLSWNAYPGAICYTVYVAEDPNDPNGAYIVEAECISDPEYDLTGPGPYRVSAITENGETELSDPINGPPPPCDEFIDDMVVQILNQPPDGMSLSRTNGIVAGHNTVGGFSRPWVYQNHANSEIRTVINSGSVQASQSASDVVIATDNFFEASHVNKFLQYDSGGNRVRIIAFISPTQVQVATSQTVALSTFKIYGNTLGGNSGTCHGLNSAGQIFGLELDPSGTQFIFWFDRNTGDMRAVASETVANVPKHITESGFLLYYLIDGLFNFSAFIYNPNTQLSTPLTHSGPVVPTMMNESLTAVGGFDSGGNTHAFRWSGGVFTDIHPAAIAQPGTASTAYFINNAGFIMGEYRRAGDSAFRVFYNNGGTSTSIGDFGDAGDLNISQMNENGVAVGSAVVGGLDVAWRWSLATGLQNLGVLAGQTEADANAINADGWIVGTSGPKAFLWVDGIMYDLITLLPPGHGWTSLGLASTISDDGEIIGIGVKDGVSRPFFCKVCIG